jgi:DHA1 family inner membrane transport protein
MMSGGLSLAVVAGVPLGTFAGQFSGWRGPFWMLAVLAVPAIVAVVRFTPATATGGAVRVSVRSEVSAVRPWRVWVLLSVIVLAQAGFLGAYSFISPLLTERAGIPVALVPLVLVGFGIGALTGTTLGGRVGDRRPLATITAAVSLTAALLLVLAATAGDTAIVVVVVVLLGASGLGANPVLIAQALRFAGHGRLASSLATSAFNLGTAAGSALAATTLSTSLGLAGPAVLGAAVTATALIPIALLATTRARPAAANTPPRPSDETQRVPTGVI